MRDMIQRPETAEAPRLQDADAAMGVSKGLDVRKYFYMIAKRLWLLLVCFMTSIVIMLVMMARQVPEYQATAKLQLTRSVGMPSNLQQRDVEAILGDYTETQCNVIRSRDVIQRAKDKLGLPPQEFGEKFRKLEVYPVWQTAILAISVNGLDPNFCADYANAIADAYVDYKTAERSGSSQNTVDNLSRQASDLADKIAKMEEELLAFVRKTAWSASRSAATWRRTSWPICPSNPPNTGRSACCWKPSNPC